VLPGNVFLQGTEWFPPLWQDGPPPCLPKGGGGGVVFSSVPPQNRSAGSRAAGACEPRQIRKEAAVCGSSRVQRGRLAGRLCGGTFESFFRTRTHPKWRICLALLSPSGGSAS